MFREKNGLFFLWHFVWEKELQAGIHKPCGLLNVLLLWIHFYIQITDLVPGSVWEQPECKVKRSERQNFTQQDPVTRLKWQLEHYDNVEYEEFI